MTVAAQSRDHNSFEDMTEVVVYVIESFADHAPGYSCLLITNHPLDTRLVDYQGLIKRLCQCQFNGSLYSPMGIKMAVENSSQAIAMDQSSLESLL